MYNAIHYCMVRYSSFSTGCKIDFRKSYIYNVVQYHLSRIRQVVKHIFMRVIGPPMMRAQKCIIYAVDSLIVNPHQAENYVRFAEHPDLKILKTISNKHFLGATNSRNVGPGFVERKQSKQFSKRQQIFEKTK